MEYIVVGMVAGVGIFYLGIYVGSVMSREDRVPRPGFKVPKAVRVPLRKRG